MGRGKLCGTAGHELSRVNDAGPGRDAEKKMKMKKNMKIIPQALPHKFFDTPPHLISLRNESRIRALDASMAPCFMIIRLGRSLLFRRSFGARISLLSRLLVYLSASKIINHPFIIHSLFRIIDSPSSHTRIRIYAY